MTNEIFPFFSSPLFFPLAGPPPVPEATLQVQDIASLSAVKAFWWRCFVHYHQSHGSTEKLEDLLPEVSKFAAALEGHIQSAVSCWQKTWRLYSVTVDRYVNTTLWSLAVECRRGALYCGSAAKAECTAGLHGRSWTTGYCTSVAVMPTYLFFFFLFFFARKTKLHSSSFSFLFTLPLLHHLSSLSFSTALQQPAFVARHAEAAMDLLTVLYPDVAHRFQVIMEIVDLYCDAEVRR